MAKQPAKDTEVKKAPKPSTASAKKTVSAAAKKPAEKKEKKKRRLPKFLRVLLAPFAAFGRYVKGSWYELRQVFWPSRRATWGLTLAVILFTLFFVVLVTLLDAGFQELFKRILL